MKPMALHPVILCGGSGTRLWPLSRDAHPKQLLAILGHESLLAATIRRASGSVFAPPVVVCNEAHVAAVTRQMQGIGVAPAAVIVEPTARNTAPAIAAAAHWLAASDPKALMLVLPSDHLIGDEAAYRTAVDAAAAAAKAGWLVTFGVTPTLPETGYGYIRSGEPIEGLEGAYRIEQFVEKPDLGTAERYLTSGDWSWNTGMFVFPAARMLAELARFEPELVTQVAAAIEQGSASGGSLALAGPAFAAAPSISIDRALMERTQAAAVIPASLNWSDVGSWAALWETSDRDENANVVVGDVMSEQTTGSYLRSEGPLIAALGLQDVVIVATGDIVLAAPRDRAQEVKAFVERLRKAGRPDLL
jgi:mannose-1-phosphate guanylyltransferase/mannose-6-phosphate isomerase